jgi:hypothetical protein
MHPALAGIATLSAPGGRATTAATLTPAAASRAVERAYRTNLHLVFFSDHVVEAAV